MTMIGRVIKAESLRRGDKVLVPDPDGTLGVKVAAVCEVSFGDGYAENGIWFTPQELGSYAWPAPDVPLYPDNLVLVLR